MIKNHQKIQKENQKKEEEVANVLLVVEKEDN